MAKFLVGSAFMAWICFSFLFAVRCQSSSEEDSTDYESYPKTEESTGEQLGKEDNSQETNVRKQTEAEDYSDVQFRDNEGSDMQNSNEDASNMRNSNNKDTDMQNNDKEGTDLISSEEEGTDLASSDEKDDDMQSSEEKDTDTEYSDEEGKQSSEEEDTDEQSSEEEDTDEQSSEEEDTDEQSSEEDHEKDADNQNKGEEGVESTTTPPFKGDEKNNGFNGWSRWIPYPQPFPSYPRPYPQPYPPYQPYPTYPPYPYSQQSPIPGLWVPGLSGGLPAGSWYPNPYEWNPTKWMEYGGNNPQSQFRPVGQPSEQSPSENKDPGKPDRIREIK